MFSRIICLKKVIHNYVLRTVDLSPFYMNKKVRDKRRA